MFFLGHIWQVNYHNSKCHLNTESRCQSRIQSLAKTVRLRPTAKNNSWPPLDIVWGEPLELPSPAPPLPSAVSHEPAYSALGKTWHMVPRCDIFHYVFLFICFLKMDKGTYLPPQFFLFGLSFHLLTLNLSKIIKKHVKKYAITYFK